jgi:hypothetical protein
MDPVREAGDLHLVLNEPDEVFPSFPYLLDETLPVQVIER